MSPRKDAALESTPAQPVREIEIPAASNPRSACVGEDAGQGVGETISPAPAQPVREGQEGKAEPVAWRWRHKSSLGWHYTEDPRSVKQDIAHGWSYEIEPLFLASQPDPAAEIAAVRSELHRESKARDFAEARAERAESELAVIREALAFIEAQARNSRYGVTIELLTGQEGESYGFRFGRQGYLGPRKETALEAIEAALADQGQEVTQ